ncbi:MAG TPA: PDZ domain-containing protein, partial [Chitinophagales bacterium]|nr:PDZ domain-containing protein [Chitinophagales bacterium]
EDLRTSGKVQRGYLGVSIQEVNNELAKSKSLNITQGVYVAGVQPGTSAEKVGLREGDVIVGIDGNTVQTQSRLLELVARKRPGETVNVAVNRSGSEKQF